MLCALRDELNGAEVHRLLCSIQSLLLLVTRYLHVELDLC